MLHIPIVVMTVRAKRNDPEKVHWDVSVPSYASSLILVTNNAWKSRNLLLTSRDQDFLSKTLNVVVMFHKWLRVSFRDEMT